MGENNSPKFIQIVDMNAGDWSEHKRFPGILAKPLLTSADNPLANINIVRVPPGGIIGRHLHSTQVETVYVIRGQAVLIFEGHEQAFNQGQIVALPAQLEHELHNRSDEMVELFTIFTPPIA